MKYIIWASRLTLRRCLTLFRQVSFLLESRTPKVKRKQRDQTEIRLDELTSKFFFIDSINVFVSVPKL